MARDYAALPYDYLEEMEELSDAEFGRLCRSLLEYSMTGTPIALCGNERFYARRVMRREDYYQGSYKEKAERSRVNGAKGGRSAKPKGTQKKQADNSETQKNPDAFPEPQKNPEEPSVTQTNPEKPKGTQKKQGGDFETQKTEDKNKNKNDNDIAAVAAIGAHAREPAAAAATAAKGTGAFAYYQDKIGFNMSREASSLLFEYIKRMGDEVVIAAIDEALDANAPRWSYVKTVLQSWSTAKVHNLDSLNRYREQFRASKNRQAVGRSPRKSYGPEPARPKTAEEEEAEAKDLENNQRELRALLAQMGMSSEPDGGEAQ